MNISFIGGGNMATALIAGLMNGRGSPLDIRVADPSEEARSRLTREYGLDAFPDGASACQGADVVVLAIKPQVMPSVLEELAPVIEDGQLVLSIAAGITVARIQSELGEKRPVVRAMPNTPALIGHGVSGLFASESCRPHHLEQAERILKAAGEVIRVEDESLMDVVTAVSGSGPAYFFLLAEALAVAGTEFGLDRQEALKLAVCTAEGAGAMMAQSEEAPAQLRARVTSPGGTTQAALEILESREFRVLVRDAVEAAVVRGRALAG